MNFVKNLKKIINSGQSRSIILTGNVYDLFFDGTDYVPLVPYLSAMCKAEAANGKKGLTQAIFELNHPIEVKGSGVDELRGIWETINKSKLDARLGESNTNATFALELLRQMTECNRRIKTSTNNLLMIVEAADMLIPQEDISRMSISDRKRVAIIQDWFCDPAFMNAGDSVVLIAESRSSIHNRIAQLPHVLSVNIPLPDFADRLEFIKWFRKQRMVQVDAIFAAGAITSESIAEQTSGLSTHAIRQLLLSGDLSPANISNKVEEYMISQLGEGVVEFQRPVHKLTDVIGFSRVKDFMRNELIPGFLDGSIGGAAVGGPIGGGKTFLCEAVASELGVPVILLKGIRSMWYGETDRIFERLRRLLETFSKIVIFVDEADTQFGSVSDGQETERRLTGKIQAMMSDVRLKGRVIWFLMTARIHLLSPDIRRPGRMDLIIPVLDPEDQDRKDFITWAFHNITCETGAIYDDTEVCEVVEGYSAATYAALRSRIKAKKCKNLKEALEIAHDILQPDIEETREYQTLQAKLNCTRKSLLFHEHVSRSDIEIFRRDWKEQLLALERKGVR
eukprot:gnl/Spiro4/17865_TR9510_c0_g1_i1.p1 gnl/Spiro4/17865_TR9510_c0_g1~~gnl/Spiro4/17865_TR9510_c0_g1_i1.p1  ORF type:complete len:565 (+),score=31.78 gnl/Spiro4/17865_TR9510_c0_g1_i1:3396-5090(+)